MPGTWLARAIALVLISTAPLDRGAVAQAPRAMADSETLEGVALSAGGTVFRGIPYAAPPIGPLRWRPPSPHQPAKGTRRASAFGPSCPQTNRLDAFNRAIAAAFGKEREVAPSGRRTAEDCLYLNVWTPNPGGAAPPLPVMVWIHGGSNLSGEGSSPWYEGSRLARRGVVVVTINYRLGALGFLGHPALSAESPQGSSGNYGLLDQIAALAWVRRNIAAFGGDPDRVTLFGESAGSLDLLHLMASPLARGLFHRAIAQSGAPMGLVTRLAQAEAAGVGFARALGIVGENDPLPALRAVQPERLIAAADSLLAAGALALGPAVDRWVLPDVTGRLFDTGGQHPVPLLIGSNQREMTSLRYYLPRFERTVAGYRQWLAATAGPMAERLAALYPAGSDTDVEPALVALTTDLYFTCPSRLAARAMGKAGPRAWLYQFTRVLPGGERLGAYHGAEIGYVFDTKERWLPTTDLDHRLTDLMMRYWTRFAAAGDPNGDGLPEWPAHDATADRYLELGDQVRVGTGLRREACGMLEVGLRLTWGKPEAQ